MLTTRLTRSTVDRVFGGLCGGIGKYLGISGWWVRLAFVALIITDLAFGVLLYLLLWLLIPGQTFAELPPMGHFAPRDPRYAQPETVLLLGGGAVAVGVILLVQSNGVLQGVGGDLFAPGLLLIIGLVVLIKQIGGRA